MLKICYVTDKKF
ncbi:hypothetical protein ECTW09195_1219, partial [Escherichia coli TW09195]